MRAEVFPLLFVFFALSPRDPSLRLRMAWGRTAATQKAPLEFKSLHKNKPDTTKVVSGLLELVERFELSAY